MPRLAIAAALLGVLAHTMGQEPGAGGDVLEAPPYMLYMSGHLRTFQSLIRAHEAFACSMEHRFMYIVHTWGPELEHTEPAWCQSPPLPLSSL